ncbi:MAG: hypothetical protein IKE66_11785 [Hyphomicrobium sp.]|nr:hypothetical protein [Hyphomicrobium sp.]
MRRCSLQVVLAVAVAAAVQLSPTVLAAAGCKDVGERRDYQFKTKPMPPEYMSFLTDGFNPLNGMNAHKGCAAASVYWRVIEENHRLDREMYACGRWLVDTKTGARISEYELADRHAKKREHFETTKKFNCEQAQKYAASQREAAARGVKEAAEAEAAAAAAERGPPQPRAEACASPKKINRNDGTQCLVVSNPCDETVSIGAFKFEKGSGKRVNYAAQVEGGGQTQWCQDNPEAPAYEYYGFCYPRDVAAGKCQTKPYGQ